jgi:sensor histidine kinase YesM
MGATRNILIVNTVIGFGLASLNYLLAPNASRADLWNFVAGNMIYAHVIGTIAALVVPKVAMRLGRTPGPKMWFFYVASLIAVAAIGTAIAVVLLWIFQLLPAAQIVHRFQASILIATIITLIVGIGAYFIESLRYHSERTRKLVSEARYSSLQSRLQPHFLFNTINSILALIRDDPTGAEQMLQRLSRLLRYALDSQQQTTVALGEELKLVTDYLEIEHTRFGQRLRYTIDVPAQLHNWPIPPFALQTLIENSMKYAVSARRQGGAIQLHARRQTNALLLEVRDDGDAFLLTDVPAGHGLDNLIQRLHLLYGSSASLTVEPLAPGCAVRLTVPGAPQ